MREVRAGRKDGGGETVKGLATRFTFAFMFVGIGMASSYITGHDIGTEKLTHYSPFFCQVMLLGICLLISSFVMVISSPEL